VPAAGAAATPGAQRRGALCALVWSFPPPPWAMRRGDRGPRRMNHGLPARARCMRQRRRAGSWHPAVHLPPPLAVQGQQGVGHHAPICRVVWRDEALIRRVATRGPGRRLAVPHG